MKIKRSSGILLHITSLPGKYGIGTLGQEAYDFAETLKKAGQEYWQILPVGPISPALGYSPYASTSTFAGNYLLISLEKLSNEDWFSQKIDSPEFKDDHFIYFDEVINHKKTILLSASDDFFSKASEKTILDFEKFCNESHYWLNGYSLFASLSEHFNTDYWPDWEKPIAMRLPGAIDEWTKKLESKIKYYKFIQYIFFKQWSEFKDHCASLGIKIIGDIPIYINLEGADAWANPALFQLEKISGNPKCVAGVPPDYFSETGQRWGNPIYKWFNEDKTLNDEVATWWISRIKHLNQFVDIIRIDHFRGFEAYWSIPAKEKTAVKGKWIKGPGIDFFQRIRQNLGDLPLIAEDLGVITPEVEKLRDDLDLPGMKILQFAFDFNNKNFYLTHNILNSNCILYTGTHDNNTTNGWFYGKEIDDNTRKYVLEYMGSTDMKDFHWQLIRLAYRSTANLVIVPAQDILGFGEDFRMNTPGTVEGNWGWKLSSNCITDGHIQKLRDMGNMYDRIRDKKE